MKESNFENRLYKHHIYCDYLYNVCSDLKSDLENRGFIISPREYKSEKFYIFDIINYDETFEEVLLFLIQEYDNEYYGDLGYILNKDENVIDFYIVI